ncbi:MAG TPA: TonB family protein [Ignavibacteria bacterium]|jgi:TonB family protein
MYDTIALINNDSYGAPELKRLYQGFTLKGFIIAVTIHIALVAAYMLFAYISEAKTKEIQTNPNEPRIFVFEDVPPPIDENEIPPIKEEITQKVKDLASLEPVPTKKEIADDIILKTQDELNNINTTTSREGDSLVASLDNDNIKIDDKIDDKIKNDVKAVEDKIYKDSEVEKAPECINLSQVSLSMKYPETAVEIGAEGRVNVKVLVGTDGNVIKVGTISGPEIFYDEVKSKVRNLQFTAGLQNNTPVKVWVSVPFNFKLK